MKLKTQIRLFIAMTIAWVLVSAGLVYGHETTIENTDGSIRFHVEQDGVRVKRESGTDLYFVNPLNAMADAITRAQAGGKTCVVRERQETCVEVTGDGTDGEGTGGDGTGDVGDGTGGDGTDGGDVVDTGDGEGGGDDGTGDADTGTGGDIDDSGDGSGGDVIPENYGRAIYAYYLEADGSLKDPVLLEGALLQRAVIHLGWVGMSDVRFYCCKGAGAAHLPAASGAVYTIDLNTLPVGEAEPRELYSDFMMPDGTLQTNNAVNFRVVDPELVEVTLEWSIPTHRENEEVLPVEELAGYRIEYQPTDADGVPHAIAVTGGAQSSYDMDLAPGLYRFRVTAIDTDGLESEPSAWVEGNLTITGEGTTLVTLAW